MIATWLKKTAMIYPYLKERTGTFGQVVGFLERGNMRYFCSLGRHANCVEWTELQSILEKFNKSFK